MSTKRLDGKVALITGAARGMGRAIAETFAAEGANVIACDVTEQIEEVGYPTATAADLEETARLVNGRGAKCLTRVADVRDQAALDAAVAAGLTEFGQIDIAVANAGIVHYAPLWEIDEAAWQAVMDVNANGVWRTAKAVAPHMIERLSGCILVTASINGHVAMKTMAHYVASKHAAIGIMKSLAFELGPYNIRANAVLPGAIHTPMVDNAYAGEYTTGDPNTKWEDRVDALRPLNLLRGRTVLPPTAVASAMAWLASDDAEHVTGVELPVDAGHLILPGFNQDPTP